MSQLSVLALACALFAVPVMAEEHRHQHPDATYFGATAQFYEMWQMPDAPGVSCCSNQDCAPVSEVRNVGGRWEARRESDGAWLAIPPEKVEQLRDSPDGRSHMCSRGSAVFCFKLGAGI
jgi:hypothetical protein